MAETILCAVDDSDAARQVFDTARGLADASGADLIVVHVRGGDDADAGDSIRARLAGAAEAAEVRLVEGSPARTILEMVEQEPAALLVIGSRGRSSLRAAVLGSVSRELASRARCPVVIVPPGTPSAGSGDGAGRADESIVCGVDGSDEALAAARLAGRLATQLGCRLVVVHARQNLRAVASYPGASSATPPVTGQEDSVRELTDEVVKKAEDAAGVDAVGVVEPGPPAEVLESVADRERARLIVIASRGVGALRAALLGSVAAELPLTADRPVVVLSGPAAAVAARSAP